MGLFGLAVIIFLIMTACTFIILLSKLSVKLMEPFYDITPYSAHWNIFKCLDEKCLREQGYECYKWCDNIDEEGARRNCKMRCADYADQQSDTHKFQRRNWFFRNPDFSRYSLLTDTDDFVMTRGIPKSQPTKW
jgi:hypothetical protein